MGKYVPTTRELLELYIQHLENMETVTDEQHQDLVSGRLRQEAIEGFHEWWKNPGPTFEVKTMIDGIPSIIMHSKETKEQIERRVRDEEFSYWMRLLKANNDTGSMTPAMWLMFEDAYYEKGLSGTSTWRIYLRKLEQETGPSPEQGETA